MADYSSYKPDPPKCKKCGSTSEQWIMMVKICFNCYQKWLKKKFGKK